MTRKLANRHAPLHLRFLLLLMLLWCNIYFSFVVVDIRLLWRTRYSTNHGATRSYKMQNYPLHVMGSHSRSLRLLPPFPPQGRRCLPVGGGRLLAISRGLLRRRLRWFNRFAVFKLNSTLPIGCLGSITEGVADPEGKLQGQKKKR